MTSKATIQEHQKEAMKSGDRPRLAVLRLILAAIKRLEVDQRRTLDDQDVLAVLEKMVKQRRDSIAQFRAAQRQELVDQEEFEIGVITRYLPEPLSDDQVRELVDRAIAETGATSMKDMGTVMAALKPQLQGRADMAAVSQLVRGRLG